MTTTVAQAMSSTSCCRWRARQINGAVEVNAAAISTRQVYVVPSRCRPVGGPGSVSTVVWGTFLVAAICLAFGIGSIWYSLDDDRFEQQAAIRADQHARHPRLVPTRKSAEAYRNQALLLGLVLTALGVVALTIGSDRHRRVTPHVGRCRYGIRRRPTRTPMVAPPAIRITGASTSSNVPRS